MRMASRIAVSSSTTRIRNGISVRLVHESGQSYPRYPRPRALRRGAADVSRVLRAGGASVGRARRPGAARLELLAIAEPRRFRRRSKRAAPRDLARRLARLRNAVRLER